MQVKRKMNQNKHYIFDVDGTLTDSRMPIDKEFAVWFSKFCENNNVYLVTGSDRSKTIEQIGAYIYAKCKRVYQCSGNDVWQDETRLNNEIWKLPANPWKYLESKLLYSSYHPKRGWHFDERSGLLNFSILGRGASNLDRKNYVEWDKKHSERASIANEFNMLFSAKYKIIAQVAGATGIDIMPIGKDKSQILVDFPAEDVLYFFGDMCLQGGNDYEISQAIIKRPGTNYSHTVENWKHTWELLNDYTCNDRSGNIINDSR